MLGNNDKSNIENVLDNYLNSKDINFEYSDKFLDFGSITYTEKTRAVLKVQDGCNQFCSYCIIPYARGRIRSRSKKSVLDEITLMAKRGIKEVVITGIHVASYGKDLKNNYFLIDLLEDINKIDGIERIRLGSLEPTLITKGFCDRISKLNKICHHFHLSLQSGCNKTLKDMNRKYTVEEFENVTNLLREVYDDVILTTDIIVGFPNETDEDFENTFNFLKKINFYKMHVFKYSPRKGTVAAKMKNQVPGNIKEKRSKILLELSDSNERKYLESYIGKNVDVLFEEIDGDFIKGHTQNYIMVNKRGSGIVNNIENVYITDVNKDSLISEK